MKKLPPKEKIFEAWSAIADGRVTLKASEAAVDSSNGKKTYAVRWTGETYSSNDSASYWQMYAGYPIIAVLMLQGKLPLAGETARLFAGINWTERNAKHGRDYAKAANEALGELQARGTDLQTVESELARAYEALAALPVIIKRGSLRPPK